MEHRAASLIQVRWLRYSLFAHIRRPGWASLRVHLQKEGLWPYMWAYELVRREWRQEGESWLNVCESTKIITELEDGLWGRKTIRLVQCV